MRPTKYSPVMRYSIVSMYSEGLSLTKIAEHCGISYRTLQYWITKHDLRESMDKAREETAKECIEVGLRKLAQGTEETIEEKSFTTNRVRTIKKYNEETGEVEEQTVNIPVNKTYKRKVLPPQVKAIEVLSRKYYKEFDSKAEERELLGNVLEGFTMRELHDARKENPIDAGKYIDAEFTKVSSNDTEQDK